MEVNEKNQRERGAAGRRTRMGAATAVLLFAATATCALAILIGSLTSTRIDVTATREHALSPRTKMLLNRLEAPHEIVIVADFAAMDARVRQRIGDVLIEFEKATPLVQHSALDAASIEERDDYARLLNRLATLQPQRLQNHLAAIETAQSSLTSLSTQAMDVSQRLTAAREALAGAGEPGDPARQVAEQMKDLPGIAQGFSSVLSRAAEETVSLMEDRIAESEIPPVDLARFTAMQTLTRIANEFARLTQFLQQAQSQLPNLDQAIASRLRGAAQASAAVRDEAATGMDELSRLQTPDAVLVARVIERGPAAVVVSPSGATAVRFESLFPSRQVIEAAGGTTADLGFVGEELLATSIASLNNPVNPIVAFVHAQPGRLLDRAGRPAADDVARLFGALLDRLRLRGVSAVEWPVAIEDQPSALFELDPTGARPVVWVTLGVAATTAEGAGRMGRLANAVNQLVGDGESVLLSIEPSTLPAVGESDPMTEAAALLGMNIRSGRVVLERFSRPSGAVVSPGQTIVPRAGAHPVANAIEGLSTLVPWPVPIELTEVEGVETWEILSIEDSADRWAESQWLEFKALPAAQRGMVTDPPSPNPSRDDVDGPWIVAAVAERAVEGRDQPQRFAAVGSNGWFFDEFTQQTTVIDGRTVAVVPGNAELFEALVSWLAGQDDLIAPSPRVRDVSRIAALSGAQMAAIRWMLIAGAPLLILLTGAAVRLIRN